MQWRFPFRLGIVGLLIFGIYLGYKSWQEHERNARIQAEIALLESEAAKIRRENETLAQKIEYFASPDFQEQEAKRKLGLRRQEEAVVILHEVPVLPQGSDVQDEKEFENSQSLVDLTPNYKKWWRLFFE